MQQIPEKYFVLMKKWWPSAAFALLCTMIGISAGLAFTFPVLLTFALGLFAGSLPAWLPRIKIAQHLDTMRIAEWVSLVLLVIISLGISLRALIPILFDSLVRVEAAVPLLLMTVPLYIIYIVLNNTNSVERITSIPGYLTTVFSGPPLMLSCIMGIALATYMLLLVHYIQLNDSDLVWLADKFLKRGIIPPLTLGLFFWGLLLFANKIWIMWREKQWLNLPETSDKSILMKAYKKAVENSSSDQKVDIFLETVWKKSADSYAVSRYINWAIPILGFIGTVLGISLAADGIQRIISSQSNISQFSNDLGQAIAPLGIAFDTTLIALSLSVFLMFLQTTLQRWESDILIDYENSLRGNQQ